MKMIYTGVVLFAFVQLAIANDHPTREQMLEVGGEVSARLPAGRYQGTTSDGRACIASGNENTPFGLLGATVSLTVMTADGRTIDFDRSPLLHYVDGWVDSYASSASSDEFRATFIRRSGGDYIDIGKYDLMISSGTNGPLSVMVHYKRTLTWPNGDEISTAEKSETCVIQ